MKTGGDKKDTILIVDDSPDILAHWSALLKSTYRVKVALSGEKALEIMAEDELPDLILLDILMPGLDGYETCRQIKKRHAAPIFQFYF